MSKRESIVIPVDRETKDAVMKYAKDNLLTQGKAIKMLMLEKKYIKSK